MEMPRQVFFAMLIEAALVTLTALLLVKPFRASRSEKPPFAGLLLMCVTFCWSVVFGCILALNEITFRL